MRIFKNKTLGRVLSFLSIVLLIIGMDQGLGYLLEPIETVSYASYLNHDIRQLEKAGEKADAIFVGASRTHCTFNPEVFEKELGLRCVINTGLPGQTINCTYYLTKDMIERLHPERVYIGVMIDSLLEGEDDIQQRLMTLDRMSLKNKIPMALDCFAPEEMLYFFKTYRYSYQLSLEQIKMNIYEKIALRETGAHLRGGDPERGDTEEYIGNGFVDYWSSCPTGTIPIKGAADFSVENILKDKLKYLDACVGVCKKNGVEPVIVTGVTSVMRMYACTGYQEANDFYKSYAEANGIKYYNLNYMRERETLIPDELMLDYNHCNGEGARIASEFLAQVVKKEEAGEDVSQYFYRDLDDFRKSVKRIVAVGAEISEGERENTVHISIESLHNDDVTPLYRVLICGEGENEYSAVQDWTSGSELEIALGDAPSYMIKIEAGAEDRSYGTASQEYTYEK